MSLGSRIASNSLWCPLTPTQLLLGSVGSGGALALGFSLFCLSRETGEKNIKCSTVSVSAKIFPGSMVVLNYLHVSDIFNSFVF